KLLSGNLHAPTRKVLHRGRADQTNEAFSQRRTRQAGLATKIVNRPTPGDVAVHQRQSPRNVRLAQASKPASPALRQRLRVTPHRFYEQQLRNFGQYRLRSRTAAGNLLRGVLEG